MKWLRATASATWRLLFFAAFMWMLYESAFVPWTAFDDSFMFVRYARMIMEGHGYTWNPGATPVDGLTSPLWLLVVLLVLPFAPESSVESGALLVGLSFTSACFLAIALYISWRMMLPRRFGPLAALCPLLLWSAHWIHLGSHVQTGMETLLAATILVVWCTWVLAIWRHVDPNRNPEGWWLGVLGFVAILARPEHAAVVLGAPILAALSCRHDRLRTVAFLQAAAITSVLLAIYSGWRVAMFERVLPLPFHVKGAVWSIPYEDFNPLAYRDIAAQPYFFLRDAIIPLLVVVGGLTYRRRWLSLFWLWAPLAFVALYLSTAFQIMGYAHRYYVPVACAMMVLMAASWADEPAAENPPPAMRRWPVELSALLAMLLIAALWRFTPLQLRKEAIPSPLNGATREIRNGLRRCPLGTTVALTEVGYAAAMNTHIHFLDVAGLNDPRFAEGFSARTLFKPGHEPDLITLIHIDYYGINRKIRGNRAFQSYEAIAAFAEDVPRNELHAVVWLRRDSPRADAIRKAFALRQRDGQGFF